MLRRYTSHTCLGPTSAVRDATCFAAGRLQFTPRCSSGSSAAENAHNASLQPYEGMPRYPALSVLGGLRFLDYMGTCAFAVGGSLCAGMYGLSALGCVVVGTITALGGGTVRDFVFGRGSAFWIEEWEYLAMAIACAAATFAVCYLYEPTAENMARYDATMFWADTIGLGAFAVIGTMFGCRLKYNPLLILVGTLMTCTGGGIIRDILVRRPPRVLNNYAEAYAETTICGGAVYLALRAAAVNMPTRVVLSASTVVALRCAAASTNFSMPHAVALHQRWKAN